MQRSSYTVELLGTLGCHLCDEAQALLEPVCRRLGHPLMVRDIMNDEELEHRFWDRIPVARRSDDGTELGWPFTREQVYRFLA